MKMLCIRETPGFEKWRVYTIQENDFIQWYWVRIQYRLYPKYFRKATENEIITNENVPFRLGKK